MTGWARRLPRLVVPVACGGTTHTVLVRRGQVVLVDHDRAGEAALRALGGEEPACAAVLRRWRERSVRSGPVGLPDALEDLRAWTLCRTAERARARGTSTGFHLERQVGEAAVRAMARWASAAGESGRQPLAFGCRIDWSGGLPRLVVDRVGGNLRLEVVLASTWWREVGLSGALGDELLVFRLSPDLGLRWRGGRPIVERYVS